MFPNYIYGTLAVNQKKKHVYILPFPHRWANASFELQLVLTIDNYFSICFSFLNVAKIKIEDSSFWWKVSFSSPIIHMYINVHIRTCVYTKLNVKICARMTLNSNRNWFRSSFSLTLSLSPSFYLSLCFPLALVGLWNFVGFVIFDWKVLFIVCWSAAVCINMTTVPDAHTHAHSTFL